MQIRNIVPRNLIYWDVIVFVGALLIFGAIIVLNLTTDIQGHITLIQMVSRGEILAPATFLYYLSVYILAFFNTSTQLLATASVIILALAVTGKFILTRSLLAQTQQEFKKTMIPNRVIILLSFLLLIIFSLPVNSSIYVGQIPPTVWHNSTTIAVMPFALALFWLSHQQLFQSTLRRVFLITILCILNILIKPSFFFVFCLVYPFMLLKHFGFKRQFWGNLIPVGIGLAILTGTYYLIYNLSYGNLQIEKAGIAIQPFTVWAFYSKNIPQSLLASLIFPIIYLAVHSKDLLKQSLLQYAAILYFAGIAIFALLTETGPRQYHGNFFWQCVICSYILFFVLISLFIEKIRLFGIHYWKNWVVAIALGAHVVAGISYLFNMLLFNRVFV